MALRQSGTTTPTGSEAPRYGAKVRALRRRESLNHELTGVDRSHLPSEEVGDMIHRRG